MAVTVCLPCEGPFLRIARCSRETSSLHGGGVTRACISAERMQEKTAHETCLMSKLTRALHCGGEGCMYLSHCNSLAVASDFGKQMTPIQMSSPDILP